MEQSIHGKIILDHGDGPKPVRRFVEKKLRAWLGCQGINPEESGLQYQVVFHHEGRGHFACDLAIETPSAGWRGSWVAPDLHRAFMECLSHMNRVISPRLPQPAYAF